MNEKEQYKFVEEYLTPRFYIAMSLAYILATYWILTDNSKYILPRHILIPILGLFGIGVFIYGMRKLDRRLYRTIFIYTGFGFLLIGYHLFTNIDKYYMLPFHAVISIMVGAGLFGYGMWGLKKK